MPKLSDQHKHEIKRMEEEIDRCLDFMDRLLEMEGKESGVSGSGQAIKHCLPAPYLLHHICPTIVKRSALRREEAALLSHVPNVLREIEKRSFVKHPRLGSMTAAAEYLTSILYGMKVECFHMLCLDKTGRLKENVLLNEGVYDASIFSLRLLLEELHRVKPDCIILCHNHPGGSFKPSQEDLDCTAEALYALTAEGVPMLDHFIVCNDGAASIRNNGFIPEHFWRNQKKDHKLLLNFLTADGTADRANNRMRESCLFCKVDSGEDF